MMKKRILSILMAFAMIFSFMPTAFAAPSYDVVTMDKTTLAPGETVNLKVTLPAGIETAGAFTVDMNFDKTKFEVTDVKAPRLNAFNEEFSETEKVTIVKITVESANTNGKLACNAAYLYNTMEVAGVEPGTDKANVISIIAVGFSTFVTTAVLFLGMLFLAPLFEPIYNNAFLKPAFDNVVPALFGAILFPYIAKAPKQAILPIVLPIILILIVGRTFFSSYQSYIMMFVIILSGVYSYMLHKKGML